MVGSATMRNVIIIGSGCAGNTAALYTARANLKPLVVSGHEAGGQLSLTTLVENFPGFPEGINGPELVENMRKQAEHFGAEYLHGSVVEADLSKRPFRLLIDDEWHETRTVIVASGASARWLGLPNEKKLIGHGVSSCATCDGFFYRGKKIMVIGGGDSAMEEAIFLTRFGSEVAIVHRRDAFRASKIMTARVKENPKIKLITNTVVEDVYDVGQGIVTSVKLRNVVTGEVWQRDDAVAFFKSQGEHYKAEIIASIPADEEIGLYREGDFVEATLRASATTVVSATTPAVVAEHRTWPPCPRAISRAARFTAVPK